MIASYFLECLILESLWKSHFIGMKAYKIQLPGDWSILMYSSICDKMYKNIQIKGIKIFTSFVICPTSNSS